MTFPNAPAVRGFENTEDRPVVLSVAFPYAPIGPAAVGGAEVVCSQLEASLASEGFESVVVAHADSRPCGRLYPTLVAAGSITDTSRTEVETEQQHNLDQALAENTVAVVHMHGLDFHRYRVPPEVPVLVTLHLPPSWYPESIWCLPDNYHFVCVSESQRAACPHSVQDRLTVIPNGVELPDAALLRAEGRYALMLARICPEKNLHAGLDAARLAGMPSLLGGSVFPYETHQRYFAEQIQPRLSHVGNPHEKHLHAAEERLSARFLGPVSGIEKTRLLSRAACLLLPSLAPETSSLVAMEALAFGVPVIGMAVGAVPDIVEEGRTGFLIQPGEGAVQEIAEAIQRLPELDRVACRTAAQERFPLRRTIESYHEMYRALSANRKPERHGSGTRQKTTGEPTNKRPLLVSEMREGTELSQLAPEWEEVWRTDPGTTPFQHPAWLLPWWRQFGPDGELHALALRDKSDSRLIAFLPSYVYDGPQHCKRRLLLIGTGTTDYLDGIWRSGDDDAAAEAVLSRLLNGPEGWDQVSLQQLRSSSPLLKAAERMGLPIEPAEPTAAPSLSSPLPAKIRTNVRRYRRRAEEHGRLRCFVASNTQEALDGFEELVKLHAERWESRGKTGVLSDPRVLAHHRESIPLLLEAGLLSLFHLRLGNETMGVLYGLLDPPHARERRLYLYLIGFAARFSAFSPGSLLMDEAWQYAVAHGLAQLDLLRGGEGYKQLWGAQPDPTFTLRIQRGDRPVAPGPAGYPRSDATA